MLSLLLFISMFRQSHSEMQIDRGALPELNRQILEFVDKNIGKKVGRGECWDLIQVPLNEFGADWDGLYQYGKELNPSKDEILPGDIIQFEKVVVKYQDGNKEYTESFYHHTAIVYEVIEKGVYRIAEQNTSHHGKKVSIDPLNTKHVQKGKMMYYRPVK